MQLPDCGTREFFVGRVEVRWPGVPRHKPCALIMCTFQSVRATRTRLRRPTFSLKPAFQGESVKLGLRYDMRLTGEFPIPN
jgi:hypothetical protein